MLFLCRAGRWACPATKMELSSFDLFSACEVGEGGFLTLAHHQFRDIHQMMEGPLLYFFHSESSNEMEVHCPFSL